MTNKDILEKEVGNKYTKCIQRPFSDEYFYPENKVLSAMDTYADLRLAEYRNKILKEVEAVSIEMNSNLDYLKIRIEGLKP